MHARMTRIDQPVTCNEAAPSLKIRDDEEMLEAGCLPQQLDPDPTSVLSVRPLISHLFCTFFP